MQLTDFDLSFYAYAPVKHAMMHCTAAHAGQETDSDMQHPIVSYPLLAVRYVTGKVCRPFVSNIAIPSHHPSARCCPACPPSTRES